MGLKYIKSLDGIRALAIFLVLVWHYFSCQINPNLWGGSMLYLKQFTSWTWSGVDLFFVLSGFLIGRILIYHRNSHNYFKTFYARRFFRIMPAYYLILFTYLIFKNQISTIPFFTDTSAQIPTGSYIFYIQNFWMSFHGFGNNWLNVTWSLAIEEQFYLLLPLIIYIVRKEYLPVLFFAGFFIAPIVRVLTSGLGSYVLLPARMDALLVGALIAYYYLNGRITRIFASRKSQLWILLLLLFVLVFLCKLLGYGATGNPILHTVLTLFYGTLVVLVLVYEEKSTFSKLLGHPILRFFARISYMIYLSHLIVNGLLHYFILHQQPQINNRADVLITVLSFGATILFSVITYASFEKPLLQLGKKFSYRNEDH